MNQVARQVMASQRHVAVARSFGTAAPSTSAKGGKFTAAQWGEMAVKGIRPSEIQVEKTYSSLPSVEEALVNVTLVDFKGDHYKIVGKTGETLM